MVKTQAIKIIVKNLKPQKDSPPAIKTSNIMLLLKGAMRIERLLKLSNNNLSILDVIPDLHATFFTKTECN